jgi:hypothetical protein
MSLGFISFQVLAFVQPMKAITLESFAIGQSNIDNDYGRSEIMIGDVQTEPKQDFFVES